MTDGNDNGASGEAGPTRVERRSDTELVVTRSFDAEPRIVFEAWTRPELMQRWWVPKSFGITMISCEMDARTGGTYRFVFTHPSFESPMPFFGRYLEVTPYSRLVWTNEESPDASITTVTFTPRAGTTLVEVHDKYPSKEALDAAIASGSTGGLPEQMQELEHLLKELAAARGS